MVQPRRAWTLVAGAVALALATSALAAQPKPAKKPNSSQKPAAQVTAASNGVSQPAGPKVATPAIKSLPAIPASNLPRVERLLPTPRARLTLHPSLSDPSQLVELSGRMGCSFSLRSIAAGVFEFLFPGAGLFHRGDPLFRLYDPAILADLTAAQQAMQEGSVTPLVIAGAPVRRGLVSTVPLGIGRVQVVGVPRDFPSPTSGASSPALTRPAAASSHRASSSAASPQPAKTAAQPKKPARLRIAPTSRATAGVDLKPYESAVEEAQADLADAESSAATRQQDYDAKKRLVELGALAQRSLDESASRLQVAKNREQDAHDRLAAAKDRLAQEKERAARVAAEQRESDRVAAAASGVEVIRGTHGGQGSNHGAENAVQVIRGLSGNQPTQVAAARPTATPRASTQATQTASRRSTSSPVYRSLPGPPPSSGLQYRSTGTTMVSQTFGKTPEELNRLTQERWTEYRAPADGFVAQRLVKDGTLIQPGQELLRVINTQWARAYLAVAREDVERFRPGTVVTVTFDDYPEVLFEGWINSLGRAPESDGYRAEIMVFCREGYFGTDAFATLQWLALATPLQDSGDQVKPVEAVVEDTPEAHYARDLNGPLSLVPRDIYALSVGLDQLKRSETEYQGQLQLVELSGPEGTSPSADSPSVKRLAALRKWREGFVEGMTRTIFDRNVVLTYPRSGEIRRAIEKMATAQVSHDPNFCARTMREALGWGLGDAHVWAELLPSRGYIARRDGLARPGDILVWPYTFPPRGSQHIGVAVQQNGRLMLLSNLNGRLGTSAIEGGYLAFYDPRQTGSGR